MGSKQTYCSQGYQLVSLHYLSFYPHLKNNCFPFFLFTYYLLLALSFSFRFCGIPRYKIPCFPVTWLSTCGRHTPVWYPLRQSRLRWACRTVEGFSEGWNKSQNDPSQSQTYYIKNETNEAVLEAEIKSIKPNLQMHVKMNFFQRYVQSFLVFYRLLNIQRGIAY